MCSVLRNFGSKFIGFHVPENLKIGFLVAIQEVTVIVAVKNTRKDMQKGIS